MATYLQGVQDSVEKVNPPQPNLQFEASLLQTRQSKYDAGHQKLSNLYGTILNAGLTRGDNIQARDEFFRLVDSDLQKVAGLDLSLDSNVTKAQDVFKQVYSNDNLVKDMVWTKNFNSEMERAESFKNCIDPDKCGGDYWEEGVKYMQYQKEEFANTDARDAMSFQNVEYVPYNNMMDKAIAAANDAGLSVKYDDIIGDYKVTTKNGELLVTPLTELFQGLYKNNPGFQKQAEVQAYNKRKDWAALKVNSGEYSSMQEAEVGYITEKSKAMSEIVDRVSADIGADNAVLNRQLQYLQDMADNGNMTEGSKEHIRYQQLSTLKNMSDEANDFAKISKLAMQKANNHKVIRNIGAQMDQSAALIALDQQIKSTASTLSYKDAEITMEADEYAKMRVKNSYDVLMENLKHSNRMSEESQKQDGRVQLKNMGADGKDMALGKFVDTTGNSKLGADKKAEIKAAALEAYPMITNTDLEAKGLDSNPDRIKLANKKNRTDEARAKHEQLGRARALDQYYKEKGITTTYREDIANGNSSKPMSVLYGNTSTSSGGGSSSGGSGGTGGGGGGSSSGGASNSTSNTPSSTEVVITSPTGQTTPTTTTTTNTTPTTTTTSSTTPTNTTTSSTTKTSTSKTDTPETTTTNAQPPKPILKAEEFKNSHAELVRDAIKDDKKRTYYDNVIKNAKKSGKSVSEYLLDKGKKDNKGSLYLDQMTNRLNKLQKSGSIAQATGAANIEWDEGNITNEALKIIAENHPDEKKKTYYQELLNKGGVSYIFTKMGEDEQHLIGSQIGKRLEQASKQYDGWVKIGKNEVVAQAGEVTAPWYSFLGGPGSFFAPETEYSGEAYKQINSINVTAREGKLEIANELTKNYLSSIDERDDEKKSMVNWTKKYLIKNGDIDAYGEVTYNGKFVGYATRANDDGKQETFKNTTGDVPRNDLRREDFQLRGDLNFESIKELAKKNIYLSDAIFKSRIRNKIDHSQSDYFGANDPEQAKKYDANIRAYDDYDRTQKTIQESKIEANTKIKNAMTASDAFTKYDDVEEWVVNGQFTLPKDYDIRYSKSVIMEKRAAYADALDQVYTKKNFNDFMVGAGGRMANTMRLNSIDINNKSPESGALDVKAFLNKAINASGKNNQVRYGADYESDEQEYENIKIMKDVLKGKIEIDMIEYNPISGVDNNGKKNDWSEMIFYLANGVTTSISLDNKYKPQEPLKIYTESMNTPRANVLNIGGQYTLIDGKNDPITNKKPIKIVRRSKSAIGATGMLWGWDAAKNDGAGGPKYYDVQDLITTSNISDYTPEQLEVKIEQWAELSKQQYNEHNPKVSK